jgi:transcriptional regulator of heat shock response
MLSERQEQIIKNLVREYIKTAEPVSSKFLAEKYDFGLCPSAIRIEFQNLIREGYLEQPHTSAGRVPTDKAYRFFVDSLKEKREERIEEELEDIIKGVEDKFRMASEIAKFIADNSSSFVNLYFAKEKLNLKEGLDEIFKEPESRDENFIHGFVNFLENFESNIEKLKAEPKTQVFIGRESPIPKSKDITLICSECNLPSQKVFITIMGPKRMDYEKNIKLINSLNKVLEELI